MRNTSWLQTLSRSIARMMTIVFLYSAFSAVQAVELRDYNITVDPVELEEMLAHPFENIYIDCVFEYEGFI